ncbi:hypothetical protein ACSNO4_15200 [Kocuria flava]|uniref:hypothetical protein n=1 Tax=Kocuria flava TaxID=446860 RepID=UPI003F1980D9
MNADARTRPLSAEVWQRPFVRAHHRWCEDLVLELRLRDVPGPVIGDRLGEVESHCTAAGETPEEAFGDPAAYAVGIAEESPRRPASGVRRITALSAAQVAALLVGTAAARPWARGEDLAHNAVQAGLLGVFVLLLLTLPRILGPLVRRPWAVGLPFAVAVQLTGLGAALAGHLDLPAAVSLPAAPVAVGLFPVVLVLAWAAYRELVRGPGDDAVLSPLPPQPGTADRGAGGRRWSTALTAAMLPVAYLVLAAFGWFTA